jgi:hypothetical protein
VRAEIRKRLEAAMHIPRKQHISEGIDLPDVVGGTDQALIVRRKERTVRQVLAGAGRSTPRAEGLEPFLGHTGDHCDTKPVAGERKYHISGEQQCRIIDEKDRPPAD